MPRTKEQYEAMREATRTKIHTAATRLFSQKGLVATSVQEIADAAEISVGLLYRHYKTKDDIFGALVMEALNGLGEVGKLFENETSPVELLKSFTSEILEDLKSNEEFTQYIMLITQPFVMNYNFPWMNDIIERNKNMIKGLTYLIERGQKAGQIKKGNPEQMAQYYISVIQGVCTMKHFYKSYFIPPTIEMITAHLFEEVFDE